MSTLIIGGWILLVGSSDGGITVVPTRYADKHACEQAAADAAKDTPYSIGWRCLKAGDAPAASTGSTE